MTYSYLIEPEGNTLKVNPNPETDVPGDILLRDARSRLRELIATKQLTGGSLLKINGSTSLAIGYMFAHELGHLYQTIAVCDPRLHGAKQNRYVVVISYVNRYGIGDIIECNYKGVSKVTTATPNSQENSTFSANFRGDILKVDCIHAEGNQIAIDAAARIDKLIASNQLRGGKLIKINGQISLLASYVIAHRLQHLYGAIAVYDPKICDVGIERYIVTISHGSGMTIGSVIEASVAKQVTAKVAICGYPGAGKTCLREGLKNAIDTIIQADAIPVPDDFCYVRSGCPDGDTAYFHETAQKHLEVAQKLRARTKKGFTDEYADNKADEISNIQNPLLIFDVGGKITIHNRIIMSQATHAIILARRGNEQQGVQPWQDFCQELNLPVVAIIYSDYNGISDEIIQLQDPLIGTVHYLDRQVDASTRPTIKKLAQLLISLPSKL